MARYLLLNTFVLIIVAIILLIYRWPLKKVFMARGLKVIGALLLLTAVGDNVIISLHLVDYNRAHILGVYLGRAPIEDFSYALLAAVLVPLMWEKGNNK